MATYNKRGYKPEKPEVEKEENTHQAVLNDHSETKEVFSSLDSSANKIGNWFTLNQSKVFYAIGALAVVAVGYLGYTNFILEPKEDEAANEMFQAQQYYDQAINGEATDSLYNLAFTGILFCLYLFRRGNLSGNGAGCCQGSYHLDGRRKPTHWRCKYAFWFFQKNAVCSFVFPRHSL